MKLKYETAIATLVQFITLNLLDIANGLNSVVSTCHNNGNSCVSNLVVSLLFFIITAIWFGIVWVIGYAAQQRRSKRLAQLLIVAESLIAIVAIFNIKHHSDVLSLTTSSIDLVLCIWIISLAYRLVKSNGSRIVRTKRNKPSGPPGLV